MLTLFRICFEKFRTIYEKLKSFVKFKYRQQVVSKALLFLMNKRSANFGHEAFTKVCYDVYIEKSVYFDRVRIYFDGVENHCKRVADFDEIVEETIQNDDFKNMGRLVVVTTLAGIICKRNPLMFNPCMDCISRRFNLRKW